MFKKIVATVLVLGTASVAGTALAGYKIPYDVYVSDGGFSGTFGSVRNSTAPTNWLRCEVYSYSNGSPASFMCDAYDGTKYRSCTGSSPQLLTTILALNGDDYIYVTYSGATCNYISLSKASFNDPKKP